MAFDGTKTQEIPISLRQNPCIYATPCWTARAMVHCGSIGAMTHANLATACHYGHELLDPLCLFHFARVDVPLLVHSDRVDPVELARIFSVAAERSQCLPAIAVENPDMVVRSVGHVQIFLLRVL